MKKNIPNFITLLNLTSGLIALYFVFNQDWEKAFFFLFLGILFDFIDGLAARALNVSSPMGLQLDSLADMVTSGVVPAFVLFFMIADSMHITNLDLSKPQTIWPLVALLIALGSAWRLAVFNTDERQTQNFIGLPTPANALFIASLPLVLKNTQWNFLREMLTNPYILTAIAIISVYLLNMNMELFSLKFKDFSISHNKRKILLLIISILLLPTLKIQAVPLIIFIYILISLLTHKRVTS
jgi:CDP-diacylglycerol--serine O-phosphatidyltransferase